MFTSMNRNNRRQFNHMFNCKISYFLTLTLKNTLNFSTPLSKFEFFFSYLNKNSNLIFLIKIKKKIEYQKVENPVKLYLRTGFRKNRLRILKFLLFLFLRVCKVIQLKLQNIFLEMVKISFF